jgi:hypothetical protein
MPHIAGGQKLTRMVLNAAMEAATGSTSASGVWSQRDSFQMLEMVVIQSLREQSVPSTVVQALSFLNDLEARLPTQTVRSEEQIEHQHFSTPLGWPGWRRILRTSSQTTACSNPALAPECWRSGPDMLPPSNSMKSIRSVRRSCVTCSPPRR